MTRYFRPRDARGFTYVELLVVLGLVALGVAFLLPATCCRSGETSNRVKCASNLRQIGQAMLLYANDNGGHFPRAVYVVGTKPVWGTTAGPNDVSAAIFLLLQTQDISADAFVCPSSNAEKDIADPKTHSNFTDVKKNLSYAMQNPYPDAGVISPDNLAWWTINMSAEYAVAADINPGTVGTNDNVLGPTTSSTAAQMKSANSNNHDEDGQNVLFADGHVEFCSNPFVGVNKDNIYAAQSGTVAASPVNADDNVLLPTDD